MVIRAVINEFGKDVEGSGHDVLRDAIPAFTWRNWGISRITSVRIVGVLAEI
jgi:hypothetical protein